MDKRKDWRIAYRKQSGNPEGAINKLLEKQQGFVPEAFQKEGLNILQNNNDTIVLPSHWNGKPRNWMLTAYPKYEPAAKHLPSFPPETNISSKNGSNSISELSAGNNIIPNNPPKLKSWSEWLEELRRKHGF